MANASNFDQNLFRNIDLLMREDQRRVQSAFDKAAAYVNGVFCALGNIDVRFEFDPLSLDDCRCEKVSGYEYSLMCNLKQLPYEDVGLEGTNGLAGAVKVRLRDGYRDSCEKACWEDVCTVTSSGKRYLDAKKIMTSLHQAIKNVLACEAQESASIVCQSNRSYLTLIINLHLNGVFKIHLLPAIRVSRKFLVLQDYHQKITSVFDALEQADTVQSIQIVAKPTPSFPDTLWRITFNDLENRLVNLGEFSCVRHCLYTVHLLQKKYLVAKGISCLSLYNLQMITLRELLRTPRAKDWATEKFSRRLDDLLKSVKTCLRQRENLNIFTNVNVLESRRKSEDKLLSREFGHIRKFHKEILLYCCSRISCEI